MTRSVSMIFLRFVPSTNSITMKKLLSRLPDVEDADDVRMRQPCPERALIEKHPYEIRVRGEVGQNALDCDAFLEPLDAPLLPRGKPRPSPGFKLFEQVISLIAHPRSSALP